MRHNTPGITLEQWFVNCYWKGSDEWSQQLYKLDGAHAKRFIINLMIFWQWETLPELPEGV